MLEPAQILFFAVVIVLTLLLLIIGWQIYKILFEIHKMLAKFNLMVDGVLSISNNLSKSFQDINGFTKGLKTCLSFLRILKREKKEDNLDEKKHHA